MLLTLSKAKSTNGMQGKIFALGAPTPTLPRPPMKAQPKKLSPHLSRHPTLTRVTGQHNSRVASRVLYAGGSVLGATYCPLHALNYFWKISPANY